MVRNPEQLATAIVAAADDAIYAVSLSGTVLSWNPAAERLYGYAADEVVGTNAVRFLPPEGPNDLFALLERVGRGERVGQYETVHYTRDARLVRVVGSVSPIRERAADPDTDDGSTARDGDAGTDRTDAAAAEFTSTDTANRPTFSANGPTDTAAAATDSPSTGGLIPGVAQRPVTAAAVVLHAIGEVEDYEQTRLAAEERFRAVLDVAPVALLIVDERGRIEFANLRAAELFGYDRYELLAVQVTDLLPDRVARRPRDEDDSGVRAPDALARHRDGTEFPVELGVNTLVEGRRRLIAAAIVDLSARRAAEEDLRDIARQQAAIADLGRRALGSTSIAALLDEAARVVARVLGVDYAEILELRPGDDALAVTAGVGWRDGVVGAATVSMGPRSPAGAALRAGAPLIVDDLRQERDLEASPYLSAHDAVSGISCVIHGAPTSFGVLGAWSRVRRTFSRHDATFVRGIANVLGAAIARARSEADLRATTETLSTLVAAAPVGVAVLDVDGVVRVWNAAAELLYGVGARDMVGREIVASGVVGEEASALLDRLLAGQTVEGRDIAEQRADGTDISVRLHGAPLRDSAGATVGTVVILADITSTRRLEEQLLQAQKMESVGRLAGGVAHDFNNLLTGIFGYTSLLADEIPDTVEDAQDLVEGIRESAQKAAALTAQLLAFSRRQVLQPRVVDLNEIVRGIEPLLQRIIGETVSLVTVPRTRIGRVRADPTQLEQVVVNLVVNARDAMPDGGTVVVETDEVAFDEAYAQEHFDVSPGRYVMLAVTDSGVGMDADTRLHLFEPFFTTKEPGRGTGLGLATTYGIVKQSGGHIWLYSEPGHGTTFKLYFPRVAELADADTQPVRPAAEPANDETVLLVEDEAAVRAITETVLKRQGYRVLTAQDGAQALHLSDAHHGHIDLLITDVVMPGMGGRALAEELQVRRPGLRTLFISGYTEDAIVRQGVLDANVAFLAKPFSPDALSRTVREVLRAAVRPSTSRGPARGAKERDASD